MELRLELGILTFGIGQNLRYCEATVRVLPPQITVDDHASQESIVDINARVAPVVRDIQRLLDEAVPIATFDGQAADQLTEALGDGNRKPQFPEVVTRCCFPAVLVPICRSTE